MVQNIILILIIAAAAVYLIRRFFFKEEKGCSSCAANTLSKPSASVNGEMKANQEA